MTGYYAKNHLQDNWAGADAAYHEEKLARAEAEADKWFSSLTKPQSARFNQRMADAAPYKNSPRWDREKIAAEREFHETTPEARRICELVMQDMMVLGEPSEATFFAIDEVTVAQMMQEAAE